VIVGFGHIGQTVGRLLKPFGVRVTGIRRKPRGRASLVRKGRCGAVLAAWTGRCLRRTT
jgi:phosphoglycerate dehydrogenase-like enzyme